jgi:hypothetical protein
MGIIRESLNFERGLEPKTSMDVGKSHLDQKIMDETDWAIDLEKHSFLYDIIKLIRNYRGYPILILKNKQQESYPYRAISERGVFGDYQSTPEKALANLKKSIDNEIAKENASHDAWKASLKKNESLDFERGLDPKKAMGIGRFSGPKKEVEAKILQLMNKIVSDPAWEGDLNYVDSVSIDKWTDGSWNIEIGAPFHFTQFGREIKKILKQIGLEIVGKMDTFVRGDYRYYQFPIKALPISES